MTCGRAITIDGGAFITAAVPSIPLTSPHRVNIPVPYHDGAVPSSSGGCMTCIALSCIFMSVQCVVMMR